MSETVAISADPKRINASPTKKGEKGSYLTIDTKAEVVKIAGWRGH